VTGPDARRRVAVLSRRSVEQKVWQASQYEFEDVIADIDDAALVLPGRPTGSALRDLARQAANRAGRPLGRDRRAAMRPPGEVVPAELFFAVFAAPHEIGALPLVRAQLAAARRRVAFIVEMYTTDLPGSADYIRQLRGFDHIFIFTRNVLPAVRELSGVPTSFLSTGVDALRFAPRVPVPARSIDVTSYGRRLAGTHTALKLASAGASLHYAYDTVRGVFEVSDSVDHRDALAANLQRSRYCVVYKNNDEPARTARTGGEETLTNRFFEATAAGAVLLGSAPDTPDFRGAFPWPDALVPISAPAPDILTAIGALDSEPERVAAASAAGIRAGLQRHDWSYRWDTILDAAGLAGHDLRAERALLLADRAAQHGDLSPLADHPSTQRMEIQ